MEQQGVVTYVHYAKSPICGDWVLPWDELPDELRVIAGHEGRVHEKRFRDQWRSDRVYVHELPAEHPILNNGTGYSTEKCWAYEVEPVGRLEFDPERGGHLVTSRTCERARVLCCLHCPTAPAEPCS